MDHSLQAAQLFDRLAGLYQSKYMDVSAYQPGLDSFIALLPSTSPVILEIACGPGNLTRYLLEKAGNARVHGIDLAPNMIALARANCPGASFEVMDCRQIHTLAQHVDGVVAGFCLPYLNRTETTKLLIDIAALLPAGGVLYLSAIEGLYNHSRPRKGSTGDEVYMYYYEMNEMEELLAGCGFSVISAERLTAENNPHKDVDIILVAVKYNKS